MTQTIYRKLHNTWRNCLDRFGGFLLYRTLGRVSILGLLNDRGGDFKEYCFNENMTERIAALKRNLDPKSLEVVDHCVEQMKYAPNLNKRWNELTLVDPRVCLDAEDIEWGKEFKRMYPEVSRKYPLPICAHVTDVFLFHHGLTFLPPAAQERIRGKDAIDGGAFIGDSALVLREYGPRKIYSFDISASNRHLFEKTMRMNKVPAEEIELVIAGLGEKNGTIRFHDGDGITTNSHAEGDQEAQIVSIDHFASERNLQTGLIKMDIEGAESGAVRGAVETLRRDRPILSIAIYHNPTDFFELKPFLESLDLNYKWMIRRLSPEGVPHVSWRHHCWWAYNIVSFVDTNLIGYPAELVEE